MDVSQLRRAWPRVFARARGGSLDESLAAAQGLATVSGRVVQELLIHKGVPIAEHAVEATAEKVLERAAEHAAERAAERFAERAVEATAERALERAAECALEHAAERAVEVTAERALERAAECALEHAAERVVEATTPKALKRAAECALEHAAERAVEATAERALEHAAECALEHAAERAVETAAERALEHAAERAVEASAEHLGEKVGEVLLERGAHIASEKMGERMVERGAESVGERLLEESARGALQNATAAAAAPPVWAARTSSLLGALRVVVPAVGTLLVLHMAHADWHRAVHEWRRRKVPSCCFALAAACDLLDVVVHVVVLASLLAVVHVDHDVVHDAERVGLCAAGCAVLSMVCGEALCIRDAKRAKAKVD